VHASSNRPHAIFHADGRGETAEEETAAAKHAPRSRQHGVELRVIAREMQNGAADHDVCGSLFERDRIERRNAEVLARSLGREMRGEIAHPRDRHRVRVDAADIEPLAQEVHEIPSAAAARVEDRHPARNSSAQQLIEEIDVDLTELGLKIR
jgi:hypothetical protein